jgi:uncharacterized protein (DUF983 family)
MPEDGESQFPTGSVTRTVYFNWSIDKYNQILIIIIIIITMIIITPVSLIQKVKGKVIPLQA